ncbi:hypothetical protein A3Q56_08647 [Intoshia linei]|uniref:LIM zinc-binding domain-containing protein n=1 Tax=Intoshia linei TaxID=1819745 RepID=A0A177ANL2_9BILA|nr:hypothetical protein A3Q56_08647 [Intoshia linei]
MRIIRDGSVCKLTTNNYQTNKDIESMICHICDKKYKNISDFMEITKQNNKSLKMHRKCAKCCSCFKNIDKSIICNSIYGILCSKCSITISVSDFTVITNGYHFHKSCYVCLTCKANLFTDPGPKCRRGYLVCRDHADDLDKLDCINFSMKLNQ